MSKQEYSSEIKFASDEYFDTLVDSRDIIKIESIQEKQMREGYDTSQYSGYQLDQIVELFLILKAEGHISEFFNQIQFLRISYSLIRYIMINVEYFDSALDFITHLES